MHKHKCSLCEMIWQHGEEYDNDVGAHECPACGCHQFRIFKDADSAVAQASADQEKPDPIAALSDTNWFVRATTAFALDVRTANAQRSVPKLAQMVTQDPYPLVRLAAVEALWRFGVEAKTAVPIMIRALSDRQAYVRRAAALALGSLGPAASTALMPLTGRLSDDNEGVRTAAASALKIIGAAWFGPISQVWVTP
jgi:HEAT repeat protein